MLLFCSVSFVWFGFLSQRLTLYQVAFELTSDPPASASCVRDNRALVGKHQGLLHTTVAQPSCNVSGALWKRRPGDQRPSRLSHLLLFGRTHRVLPGCLRHCFLHNPSHGASLWSYDSCLCNQLAHKSLIIFMFRPGQLQRPQAGGTEPSWTCLI